MTTTTNVPSPVFVPDNEKIGQAIIDTGCSPLAVEDAAGTMEKKGLVEYWIERNPGDVNWKIVAVECGFVCWLDPDTVIIGVQDLLTEDAEGVIGNEWKTTKESSRYWNEEAWLEEISSGSQVGIYALGMHSGRYYEKSTRLAFEPKVTSPRIRVRAVSKSNPPQCWPTKESGILTFSDADLARIESALLVKAAQIRVARRTGRVPWQLPGIWCTNKFKRQCEYYSDCTAGKIPTGTLAFDQNDPAYQLALPHVGDRVNDPELVILGASAYSAYSECAENGRRNTLKGNQEDSLALQIGTCFHAGAAEFYRQLKEFQCASL